MFPPRFIAVSHRPVSSYRSAFAHLSVIEDKSSEGWSVITPLLAFFWLERLPPTLPVIPPTLSAPLTAAIDDNCKLLADYCPDKGLTGALPPIPIDRSSESRARCVVTNIMVLSVLHENIATSTVKFTSSRNFLFANKEVACSPPSLWTRSLLKFNGRVDRSFPAPFRWLYIRGSVLQTRLFGKGQRYEQLKQFKAIQFLLFHLPKHGGQKVLLSSCRIN